MRSDRVVLMSDGDATRSRVERRLAAILAADVAGYSRLMEADEEGTLDRLKAHRRQLIDPKIREHRGRIVKTTGDGMLAEFPSVVDAVRCAVEIQRGMVDRNAEVPDDKRITFRIGVNLGDVIIDGDDIYGDGVNISARLEALAEPGGICVARTVRNQIRDKLPYTFEDMGEQSVKNIARPVRADAISATAVASTPLVGVLAQPRPASRGLPLRPAVIAATAAVVIAIGATAWWAWPQGTTPAVAVPAASPQGPPAVANTAAKPAPRLSIVVLPFANLSADPEQEYFVDAVTDDLTTDLTRISDSFVIARTTAFTYKGKPVDVRQIGRELGVRYVLEGSVRRLGDEIQVNVQLIDTETGAHLWADRFDTDRTNLAKAQSQITAGLARTLHLELMEAVDRQIEREKNPDARDLVMRGWAWYYRPVSEGQLQGAQRAFEQALEKDPGSVDARAGIASVLLVSGASGFSKSPQQDQTRAEQLLLEALERNGNHTRALWAGGWLRRLQGRLVESQIDLEKVIALDRNFAPAEVQLGYTLNALGQPEAALPHFERALELTPRDPNRHWFYSGLGFCHLLLGHANEAVDFFRKARATNPRIYYIYLGLAAALGLRGDIDEAKSALAEFLKLKPDLDSFARLRAFSPPRTPQLEALAEKTWDVGLRRAGLPEE
jgi:adenylate cyclase